MTYDVDLGGRRASVSVRPHPQGGWWIAVDGGPEAQVNGSAAGPGEWWLADKNGRRRVALHVDGDKVSAQIAGRGFLGTVVDPRRAALADAASGAAGAVVTPMPGAIVRIVVEEGQQVEEGQVLIVVEAMKMENEFKSTVRGTVTAIHVEVAMAVEAHTLLVTVEPAEAP